MSQVTHWHCIVFECDCFMVYSVLYSRWEGVTYRTQRLVKKNPKCLGKSRLTDSSHSLHGHTVSIESSLTDLTRSFTLLTQSRLNQVSLTRAFNFTETMSGLTQVSLTQLKSFSSMTQCLNWIQSHCPNSSRSLHRCRVSTESIGLWTPTYI